MTEDIRSGLFGGMDYLPTGADYLGDDVVAEQQPRRTKKQHLIIPEEALTPAEPTEYVPQEITVKALMAAGAHYGHQSDKWNPKMLPYIFTERKGVHIINLDITMEKWKAARQAIVDAVSKGGTLLFVGTKQQARLVVERHAKRCGSYFATRRWLGGTLTNFSTIRKSIDRMKRLEELLEQATTGENDVRLNKKERLTITRQLETLDGNIGGIRNMKRVPDVLFVIDLNKEHIAVAEAKRLGMIVIALADTNVNPSIVNHAIPSNDDSTRSIELFVAGAADAVLEGLQGYESYKRESPRRDDSENSGRTANVSNRSHGRRGERSGGGKGQEVVAKVEAESEVEQPAAASAV